MAPQRPYLKERNPIQIHTKIVHRPQAQALPKYRVTLSMISPEAQAVQREEEEESSQGIDSQQEDEGGNDRETN